MNVKVWNNNIYPYTEKFRNRMITIEANSFIEMDEDEADAFLIKFRYPHKDPQGRPDPRHFKMLKIEVPQEVIDARREREQFINHANGQRANSSAELAEALKSFAHMAAGRDPEAEGSAIAAKNKALAKENKALKSRLDAIEEKLGLRDTNTHAESV